MRVMLHQPLLHYYAAVASTSAYSALVATVAVDTARRFQPPLLWRCCRSHRKKITNVDRKSPPLLRHKNKNLAIVAKTSCSIPTRHLPAPHLSNCLLLSHRGQRHLPAPPLSTSTLPLSLAENSAMHIL
jgi:hypothetical protein